MITFENVTVSYRNHIALKGVDLTIEKGDHFAVIGPNGAGKTTLLCAVNGLGVIQSGSLSVFGKSLNRKNIRSVRKRTGYVPQNLHIEKKSPVFVSDVVAMGRYGKAGLLQRLTSEDWSIIESAIALCNIEHLAKRPAGHLSGGEQQKVFIARAMAQEPDILLLDEPTANLDLKGRKEIIELIDKIHEEKKLTILFVTHILGSIPSTCKKACLLKNGEILFTGPIEESLEIDRLSDLYGCRIIKGESLTYG